MWVLVDEDAPKETQTVWIFGTGHLIPESINLKYINTFFLAGGTLVFHAFVEAHK